MPNEPQQTMWREHRFEIFKTLGEIGIGGMLAIFAYVWSSTVTSIRADLQVHARYIEQLSERVRIAEIAAEGNRALVIGLSDRVTKIERDISPYNREYPYQKKLQ